MAVVLDVKLGRFSGVMCRVVGVPLRQVRMVSGGLVVACLVMSGGFPVMAGGVFVMFCRLEVVSRCLFGHVCLQLL